MKSVEKPKKVQFSDSITIHEVCICEYHKSARSGLQWIQAAADRQRFKMRILKTSLLLDDVIKKKKKKKNSINM